MEIWTIISEQWQQQSIIEVFAVLAAVTYVWLAAEESSWCWPFGFLGTILYAFIYWDVSLVFQTLLNVYYIGMALWGFITWRRKGLDSLEISRMSFNLHMAIIVGGIAASGFIYLCASYWLLYDLLLIDIIITVFSLTTTYLTVKKKLENWIYWTVINTASIYLLIETELYLSILLMFVYILIALKGLNQWLATYSENELRHAVG